MKLATSFTGSRGQRFPAPDVARGFMLLFIALANIPFWVATTRSSAPSDAVDSVWLWARTLLVDHRAYPLFAMLFGFGLVTMVNRRITSGTRSYLESLPGVEAGREPTEQEEAWAREQATVDARRLVRRRGLWMILFGAVHAVLFSGDIIGTYGLAAVIFAGWLTRKHRKRAMAVCGGHEAGGRRIGYDPLVLCLPRCHLLGRELGRNGALLHGGPGDVPRCSLGRHRLPRPS